MAFDGVPSCGWRRTQTLGATPDRVHHRQRHASHTHAHHRGLLRVGRAASEGKDGMSEELASRLRKAEEEAAALRRQLELLDDAGSTSSADGLGGEDALPQWKGMDRVRVKRETFFTTGEEPTWYPGESGDGMTTEEQGEVRRRLLLGALGAVAIAGFGIVPTEKLDIRGRPRKPLFAYLVPVVESLERLPAIEEQAEYGRFDEMGGNLKGVLKELKPCMESITKLLDGKKADRARELTREAVDYLSMVSRDEYFDTLLPPTGKQKIEYTAFALKSLEAATGKLEAFLRLVPEDDLEAARAQISARKDAFAPASEEQAEAPSQERLGAEEDSYAG